MAGFSFNAIDLAAYGVKVVNADRDSLSHSFATAQLENKAYSWKSKLQPRGISLDVVIQPVAGYTYLYDQLSAIRQVLNEIDECQLILGSVTTRYWLAKLQSFKGEYKSPDVWRGTIDFLCPDPRAFSTTETESNHNVDADPDTIIETTTGTARVEPVYLFTAGEDLTDITLELANQTTGKTIEWTGSLANTEELEIDCETWLVKKEGTADMDTVDGEFPWLSPGTNTLVVTGFSNTGTLKITYRKATI